jgi:hypothetical protein
VERDIVEKVIQKTFYFTFDTRAAAGKTTRNSTPKLKKIVKNLFLMNISLYPTIK